MSERIFLIEFIYSEKSFHFISNGFSLYEENNKICFSTIQDEIIKKYKKKLHSSYQISGGHVIFGSQAEEFIKNNSNIIVADYEKILDFINLVIITFDEADFEMNALGIKIVKIIQRLENTISYGDWHTKYINNFLINDEQQIAKAVIIKGFNTLKKKLPGIFDDTESINK